MFELVATYQPAGDQPQAIAKRMERGISGQAAFGGNVRDSEIIKYFY
jgi:excinuclease UvrABC helicase subunit UvrB